MVIDATMGKSRLFTSTPAQNIRRAVYADLSVLNSIRTLHISRRTRIRLPVWERAFFFLLLGCVVIEAVVDIPAVEDLIDEILGVQVCWAAGVVQTG